MEVKNVSFSDDSKTVVIDGVIYKREKQELICKIDNHGTKFWYLNGNRHREDGLAVEYENGDKYWFLNDLRHREDGSEVIYSNGKVEYWINGVEQRVTLTPK